MIALRQGIIFAGALALATLAAWRVIATGMADRFATTLPERALTWEPRNPTALLALAERQLTEHDPDAAAATARKLLRSEPLVSRAFVVIAEASDSGNDVAASRTLHEIALRRAPRDLRTRAWIINARLRENRYADALDQFNVLWRISPQQASSLFPVLAQLADGPEFAQSLAHILSTRPPWRNSLLAVVLAKASLAAITQILGALQSTDDLSDKEMGYWLERLMHDGLWGEAYSRWASELKLAPGAALPLVYDGGFQTEPSGTGFGWRISNAAGVIIARIANDANDETGPFAVKVSFSGRRAAQINFAQTLLLAPGSYRLRFRARAMNLRSDRGLQWAIACQGANAPLAVSAPLGGSFGWAQFDTPFVIPEKNCAAQYLGLRNPGAAGAGKEVQGDLWCGDFMISNEQVI